MAWVVRKLEIFHLTWSRNFKLLAWNLGDFKGRRRVVRCGSPTTEEGGGRVVRCGWLTVVLLLRQVCGSLFDHRAALLEHKLVHNYNKCPICNIKLKSRSTMRQHLQVHAQLASFSLAESTCSLVTAIIARNVKQRWITLIIAKKH